jgi:hypothetical protein
MIHRLFSVEVGNKGLILKAVYATLRPSSSTIEAAILYSMRFVSSNTLRVERVPQPNQDPSQVLVRIRACSVCRTGLHILDREPHPPRRPLSLAGSLGIRWKQV